MSFLDNIGKFIDSPYGRTLASALLKNKGNFGQGLGAGLLGMEEVDRNKFNQDNKSALLDLKREGMDLQRMSTEASIQNMQQSRAESYQRLKMMMDERKRQAAQQQQQQAMMQGLSSLIGSPGQEVQTPEIPGVPYSPGAGWSPENLPTPASTEVRGGEGLLGGKISKEQFNAAAAKIQLGMGDVKGALSMLNPKSEKFSAPREVINPTTGQPELVQISESGVARPVQGALPAAKNGVTHTLPDGSVIQVGGTPQQGLGKPAVNDIEKRMTITKTLLKGIGSAKKLYDPEFLTLQGKGKETLIDAMNFVKIPLTREQKEFHGKEGAFAHEIGRTLHSYMQSVVGSRGGVRMLQQIEKSFPNMKLRPNKMEWALNNIEKNLNENLKTLDELRKTGKFTEEEIKKEIDDQAMKGMEKIINGVVENGSDLTKTLKELDEVGEDRDGLGSGGYLK